MLLFYMLLELIVMLIIEPIFIGMKIGEDIILFLSPLITTGFVTFYIIKKYQKV